MVPGKEWETPQNRQRASVDPRKTKSKVWQYEEQNPSAPAAFWFGGCCWLRLHMLQSIIHLPSSGKPMSSSKVEGMAVPLSVNPQSEAVPSPVDPIVESIAIMARLRGPNGCPWD